MRRTYVLFFVFELIAVSWISLSAFNEGADWFIAIGGFFTIIIHPFLFYVIPSLVLFFFYNTLRKYSYHSLFIFIFPFIWVGFEYLQTLGQINFPWLFLAYTQTYNLEKIQFIDVTGMFGITFWICVIGCLLYKFFFYISIYKNNFKKLIPFTAIILLLYVLPDCFTFLFIHQLRQNPQESQLQVSIIQPNVNPWKKWGSKINEITDDYASQIKEAALQQPKPDLIILPETAFPYYLRYDYYDAHYKVIQNVVDSINIPVLTGTPDLFVYPDPAIAPPDARTLNSKGEKYDVFNSAVLIEPGKHKDSLMVHNKSKLVIASERMPYQEKLTFLQDMIKWSVGLSSFQMGQDTTLFDLNIQDTILSRDHHEYKFNVAICYESVYPEFIADYVRKGSEFIVIITNDGWWGKLFGVYQHNQYAVFRAIENRRWIARCANTGISCFITPNGKILDATEVNAKTIISRNIEMNVGETIYTQYGDILGRVSMYLIVILFLAFLFIHFRYKKISKTNQNF
jgi:apolipoprotein N-acyltransferase